jgi:sugar phosphate isomerase/epimerase
MMSSQKRDACVVTRYPNTKVQCSTGPLARAGGGSYDEVEKMVVGVSRLGWPRVEMRLWNKWPPADYVGNLESVLTTSVSVPTIHAPALTEELLSRATPDDAGVVLDRCVQAARASLTRTIVFHGWDLRRPQFDEKALVRNLNALQERYAREPLVWCAEALPGYSTLLPLLERECPHLRFVLDTQWATVEGDLRMLLDRTPVISGIHVQSFLDFDSDGSIVLGRTRFGASCDVREIVRELQVNGFSGEMTLEPLGVTQSECGPIRKALEFLVGLEFNR